MILRNHGLLTCGRSVGKAFRRMYDLECVCRAQLAIMAAGGTPRPVDPLLAEFAAQQEENWRATQNELEAIDVEWEACLRLAKKRHPALDR